MPSVTVAGSGGGPVNYTTNEGYSYALNAANQIAAAIGNGATAIRYNGTPFAASASQTVDVFSATAPSPASPILLSTTAVGIINSLATALQIQGGAAGASVVSGSGGLTYTNITASGSATANIVASGTNYLQTATTGAGNYNFNTGSGNDTIVVLSGNATVNAGSGQNLIVLGGGANSGNSLVYSEGYDSIVGNILPRGTAGSGGTDTVNIGSGATTVNPGSSNFFIFNNQFDALTLLQGVGSDTVSVGQGGGSVIGGLAGNNYLFAGSGGANSAGTTIRGAASGDHLFAIGAGNVTVIAGAGNETVTGAVNPAGFGTTSATGSNLLVAGSGIDIVQAGAGNSTLVGGSGSAQLIAGSGANMFQIISGTGGADTITGFNASSTLQLTGFGASLTAANALNTALVQGGNTVLTLVDGTTLTFANGASVSNSQIKTF